jgi:type IX secretion system PorP/SprF family membrane protein
MKKSAILFFALSLPTFMQAQQIPIFSQYMLNPFIINPAAAGIKEEPRLFLHYRNQWMGFEDAPKTMAVSFETPLAGNKYGIGMQFLSDQSHILSNSAGRVSYRYTLPFEGGHKLGFGLYGGFMQRKINFAALDAASAEDPLLLSSEVRGTVFDAGFGTWYTWKQLEAGISIDQLLNNKFNFEEDVTQKTSSFQNIRHFTLNAAYEYRFKGDKWAVKPCVALRSFQGANINVEGTVIGKWKDLLWAGVGYRQQFGIIALAGVEIAEQFTVGYSFDYSTGEIRNYASGSHEVLLSYRFGKRGEDGVAAANRQLRRQADALRDIKDENRKLREDVTAQKEELERIRKVQELENEDMKKVIEANKVESIPDATSGADAGQNPDGKAASNNQGAASTNKGSNGSTVGGEVSSDEIKALKERLTALEKQLREQQAKQASGAIESPNGDGAKTGQDSPESSNARTGKYYIVVGSYFKLEDAKAYQNILQREIGMETKVVSRSDRKFFFVVSKEVTNNDEAQREMKDLKTKGIDDYINGNLWIYAE